MTHTDTSSSGNWNFDHSYARLPGYFYEKTSPVPVAAPRMAVFNRDLADALGLDPNRLDTPAGAAMLAGNVLPQGALPIAQAYAGHQFGYFTMLGDGRAILLGEHITPSGERFDIQLKGAGRTVFSRNGDGRAALGPMLREYIISEAMHGLGIPTTRSLAVVATGEPVYRETRLPGAVLTRVASSHIRVGTFQYVAAQKNREDLRTLVMYTIDRHFPDLRDADNPALALLAEVLARQASLVARWLHVGFIHGVMNTDNMALSGESIDYGPCAFMDAYNPATVFSSIDRDGRYAYGNQPAIAQWNLSRFAETLLPLLHENGDKAVELAGEALETFSDVFREFWIDGMRGKLGLFDAEEDDVRLAQDLLKLMGDAAADFTESMRALGEPDPRGPLFVRPEFAQWRERWKARRARQRQSEREARELMQSRNPAVIARNHRVEEALDAAAQGDMNVMNALLEALRKPFEDRREFAAYRVPPAPGGTPYRTFCGT